MNKDQNESADEQQQKEFNDELDEFQREFDQIMSESLQHRSVENARSMNTEIVIPISKLHSLNSTKDKLLTQPLISLSSNQSISHQSTLKSRRSENI